MIGIYLHRMFEPGHYLRVSLSNKGLEHIDEENFKAFYHREALNRTMHNSKLLIRQFSRSPYHVKEHNVMYGICLASLCWRPGDVADYPSHGAGKLAVRGRAWNAESRLLELHQTTSGAIGTIVFEPSPKSSMQPVVLDLGFLWNFMPICRVRVLKSTIAMNNNHPTETLALEAAADAAWKESSTSKWLIEGLPSTWDTYIQDYRQYGVQSKTEKGAFFFKVISNSSGVAVLPLLEMILFFSKGVIGECDHNEYECRSQSKHFGWKLRLQSQHWDSLHSEHRTSDPELVCNQNLGQRCHALRSLSEG
jgi:hypothetical protein